ncbi:MAG TPA: DUF1656 domain-containing protein [Steroidobacteraceae bacterium]|nr:DUF1656 domain-containing protein [Steroidobacteraceae bacterium]
MLEINIGGVFVPALLIWAGGAFVLSSGIDRLLSCTRFYRLVWHRSLFGFAIFVILWGVISAAAYYFAFFGAAAEVGR